MAAIRSLLLSCALFLSAISALMVAPSAEASCACVCMEGKQVTACTTIDEAQSGINACAAVAPMSCPVAEAIQADSYAAPDARANDCRDREVFDPVSGRRIKLAKVCDV